MSDSDAQLELKKRARRRLVGAIALFLAAAIILPMVMDSEPKPAGNELQIRIPSQEGSNYASRLINSTPPAPVADAPTEVLPETTSAPAAVITPTPSVESAPVKAETPAPVVAPAVTPEPAHSSQAEKPKTEVKPAPAADDGARAKALLEGASLPAVATKYYVQLGAYRDAVNVKSVQARLKAAGFASMTEKVGQKTRVRAGPFASHVAAEHAQAKLKKSGLTGVVTPAK